jgi:tetratricopeptide (TPR) repeat protein
MTPEEAKEAGRGLFREKRYTEAIPLLKSAVEASPEDEILSQELVLAAHYAGWYEQAAEFAKQGVRHHASSGWLWRQLGSELTAADRLEEAEAALTKARRLLDNRDEWLWRYFATLHQKRKDFAKEIESLENLCALGKATSADLNQLGIAYRNHGDLAKAVECYRFSVAAEPDVAPLFNMGLAFAHPELSQDVDAADAYRRALFLNPNYDRATRELEAIKQKLTALAATARGEAHGLIATTERFQFYLSPFEALMLDNVEDDESIEVKTVQRARTRLLQEIELNDGKVSWLDDYALDKSRAITLDDELCDPTKRQYHWAIFQNKPLLRFLTKGDIEHFLYSDDYFPRETLALLDDDEGFRGFLSGPFSKQYNLVLSRAVERHLLDIVEVLFDGRRWVEPEDEDICLEGAWKHINDLVQRMHGLVEEGKTRRVDIREVQRIFEEQHVVRLFNLLPAAFRPAQSQLVREIRDLAISCHNEHADSELSARVLDLCKLFHFKGTELDSRLKEDTRVIEEIVAENRKHAFSAWVHEGQAAYITHKGISFAGDEVSVADIETVRWGIYARTVNGVETEHSCTLVVGGGGRCVTVQLDKRGLIGLVARALRKKDDVIPIDQLSSAHQEAYFHRMIDAVLHYLVPPLTMRLVEELRNGGAVQIGPCNVNRSGLGFCAGLIFSKDYLVSWTDVETRMESGQIRVFSRSNPKAQCEMSLRDTDNAIILPILCTAMRENTALGQQRSQATATPDPTVGDEPVSHVNVPVGDSQTGGHGTADLGSSNEQRSRSSDKTVLAVIIIMSGIIFLGVFIALTAPGGTSRSSPYVPHTETAPRDYRLPSPSRTSRTDARTSYHVPSYISAELERDSQAIDREKTKAERLSHQLDTLSREIDRERLFLDRTSQFAVDQFNDKVNTYNTLVERLRTQNRLVNQMVADYNAKLRKYGR